jgi:hypothetical protein
MALHRAMKTKTLSALLEKFAASLKLTALFDSPVIATYEKVDD